MSGMCRPPESIEKIEIVMREIEETDNIWKPFETSVLAGVFIRLIKEEEE